MRVAPNHAFRCAAWGARPGEDCQAQRQGKRDSSVFMQNFGAGYGNRQLPLASASGS